MRRTESGAPAIDRLWLRRSLARPFLHYQNQSIHVCPSGNRPPPHKTAPIHGRDTSSGAIRGIIPPVLASQPSQPSQLPTPGSGSCDRPPRPGRSSAARGRRCCCCRPRRRREPGPGQVPGRRKASGRSRCCCCWRCWWFRSSCCPGAWAAAAAAGPGSSRRRGRRRRSARARRLAGCPRSRSLARGTWR